MERRDLVPKTYVIFAISNMTWIFVLPVFRCCAINYKDIAKVKPGFRIGYGNGALENGLIIHRYATKAAFETARTCHTVPSSLLNLPHRNNTEIAFVLVNNAES